jgi:LmbE family N-acetylglucosaminyl deacetylase
MLRMVDALRGVSVHRNFFAMSGFGGLCTEREIARGVWFRHFFLLSLLRPILFLSPHLDDVVFSCPGRVLTEVRSEAPVVVATLFTHCRRNSAAEAEYLQRRREDRTAVRLLGAVPRWLELPDAPFRDAYYDSFRTIIFGEAECEEEWFPRILDKIEGLVQRLQPARIYAPLGVGNHIDHRLAFCAAMAFRNRCEVCFYEERPYCLVSHGVAWRLNRLGAGPVDLELDRACWKAMLRARYVRTYLPAGPEQRLCCSAMRAFPCGGLVPEREWTSVVEGLAGADLDIIMRAIFSYQSQTGTFLGSRAQLERGARRYAQTLGVMDGWAERIWTIGRPDQSSAG